MSAAGLKAARERCYQSRDKYLECYDQYGDEEHSKCKKLKEKFEQDCPPSWVTLILACMVLVLIGL